MYEIRTLGPESFDAVRELEAACFPPADRWKEADWQELLADGRAVYYALTEGDRPVADVFIYNWKGEHDYVKIMNVAVHPDHRRKGAASRLLSHVTEEMTKDGMFVFRGETRASNTAMQRTFEKCGYRLDRVEEHYFTSPDESAWKYVLRIG